MAVCVRNATDGVARLLFALVTGETDHQPEEAAARAAEAVIIHVIEQCFNSAVETAQDARWSWVQQAFTALQWLLLGKDASTAGPVAWASIWLNLAVVIILTVASVQGFLHLLRTRAAQHRSLLGRVLPPGLGAATTLVVTDVQDSTVLFETLPISVVDESMSLACSITRKCAAQHAGYESATEGDSFLIAFHTAKDATLFCASLQVAFMEAPWPADLLCAPEVESVWPMAAVPTPFADEVTQVLRMRGRLSERQLRQSERHLLRQSLRSIAAEQDAQNWGLVTRVRSLITTWAPRLMLGTSLFPNHLSTASASQASSIAGSTAELLESPVVGKDLLEMVHKEMLVDESSPGTATSDDLGLRSGPLPCMPEPGMPISRSRRASTELFSNPLHLLGEDYVGTSEYHMQDLLQRGWTVAGSDLTDVLSVAQRRLIWSGLRVRCGVASGLYNAADMIEGLGRVQYGGDLLAIAKLMEACCPGGVNIIHLSTFSLLDLARLPRDVTVVHMGKHKIKAPQSSRERLTTEPGFPIEINDEGMIVTRAIPGTIDYALNPLAPDWHHVYAVMHSSQLPRLAFLPPLKVQKSIVSGFGAAPLREVTVAFLSVLGVTALRAWDKDRTERALELFAGICKQHMQNARGYLVEHTDGFVLAAFSNPLSALQWALAFQADMLTAPWSTALLTHALADEVMAPHTDAHGSNVVLLRGPRIKIGMSTGITKSEVHPNTARVSYRGKVMNRAARIAAMATSGQILCQECTWEGAAASLGLPPDASAVGGITCTRLGASQLKGIKEEVRVCQVHYSLEPPSSLLATPPMRTDKRHARKRMLSEASPDDAIPAGVFVGMTEDE